MKKNLPFRAFQFLRRFLVTENASTKEQTETTGEATGSAVVPDSTTEQQTAQPAPQPLRLQDVPTEELLKDERIQRLVQSMKDREIASFQRKMKDDGAKRQETQRIQREEEEIRKLAQDEDFDTIGRKAWEQKREEENLRKAAERISGAIETKLQTHPDFVQLGEEFIQQTFEQVKDKGGTVVDLIAELHKASRDKYVEKERAALIEGFQKDRQKIADEIKAQLEPEIEARIAEKLALQRTAAVASGNSLASGISGSVAAPGSVGLTYEQASEMFGNGEMSFAEFMPFKDKHDKERQR